MASQVVAAGAITHHEHSEMVLGSAVLGGCSSQAKAVETAAAAARRSVAFILRMQLRNAENLKTELPKKDEVKSSIRQLSWTSLFL